MCKPGATTYEIGAAVDNIFNEKGYKMPHSLGHGIGLDVHEAPIVNEHKETSSVLESGIYITIEPGLYHPDLGGIRLENDVLITDDGHKVITNSRILHIPSHN